ncbi:MAG: hypothetical protein HY392_05615 [Candidatus Diapherotrites archaeon]|nr:hypothetical protein [Candidatus Diapherotrites archaeon]
MKKIVSLSLEKPKLLLAVVLVLLPVIFRIAAGFLVGVNFDAQYNGFLMLTNVVLWLAGGIGLYAIIYIFKGSEVKGKLSGVLTASSYASFFFTLWLLLAVLVVFLLIPGFFAGVKNAQGLDPQTAMQALIEEFPQPQNEALLTAGIGILILAGFIVLILTFYTYYSIITLSSSEKPKRNFFAFIVFMLFLFIIGVFL